MFVDPLDNPQPWKDFQRLITYVVSVDVNLQQVKGSLCVILDKNNEKKTSTVKGVGGLIRTPKKSNLMEERWVTKELQP